MSKITRRAFAASAAAAATVAGLGLKPASAQAYPSRPVTVIVPWGAGGGTDATARIVAALLEKELGQPFNVVNRTGGSGVVGHSAIATAAPDGYTIGMIAINKADGDNLKRANAAAAEYRSALHILTPRSEHWFPPVVTYSALTGNGISELWQKVIEHRTAMNACGEFAARRREQQVKWMWSMLEGRMMARLRSDAAIRSKVKKTEAEVADGKMTPAVAAEHIAEWLK